MNVPTDRMSQDFKNRGFAHITFENVDQATEAMNGMAGARIDGRFVRIDYAKGRQRDRVPFGGQKKSYGQDDVEREPVPNTIFVGGLDFRTTKDAIAQHFTQYGDIVDINLPINREMRGNRGYAHVQFASLD